MKRFNLLFLIIVFCITGVSAQVQAPTSSAIIEPEVRLKDIGKIVGSRDNQLLGFGLVVGLRNTGDSSQAAFTNKALGNLLKKVGISSDGSGFKTRNVAGVMVTATLPPYLRKGQKIDVVVSSLGDSTSLLGGTLLMTPLQGANLQTIAVAQGPVIVGGVSGSNKYGSYAKNQTTVGRVPDGAIVEAEVPVTPEDTENITVVIHEPNFMTASRVSKALELDGFKGVKAIDASTIKIPLASVESESLVDVIARIENVKVRPDSNSRVVINSKTGTVVIGQMVRLFPVAITHGGVSVTIESATAQMPFENDRRPPSEDPYRPSQSDRMSTIQLTDTPGKILYIEPEATLSSLVEALNQIGVSPREMISIVQALKESGALIANIKVI